MTQLIISNSTTEQRLSSAIVLSLLSLSGMLSCGLALFLTFYARLYRTRVNLLLANVTMADFLHTTANLILQPPNIMADEKWFACDLSGYITYVTGLEANWFIPAVVLNRYLSIYHQGVFKKVYTTRNILVMILFGWSIPIAIITPFFWNGLTGFEYQYLNCGVNTEGADVIWTILVYGLVVLPTFISVGVTAYCNLRIFAKLRQHATQGAKTIRKNVMAQNRQLMYVTLLHTMFAVFLQTPYLLGKLFPVIVEDNPLRQIFPWLYTFNGVINPLTTLYVVKPYRRAVLTFVCRRAGMSQVEPWGTTVAKDALTKNNNNVITVRKVVGLGVGGVSEVRSDMRDM